MQITRQHILEILKESGESTVDALVETLVERIGDITAVTVRYHLDILQQEQLVKKARVKRRRSPGRPQYVYTLTDRAHAFFPKNYQALTTHMLEELKRKLPPEQVGEIMENVAQRMAIEAAFMNEGAAPQDRVSRMVDYLSERGYQASWEHDGNGVYALHIGNCPYRRAADQHGELCSMDTRLISYALGTEPACASTIARGGTTCTYIAQFGERVV